MNRLGLRRSEKNCVLSSNRLSTPSPLVRNLANRTPARSVAKERAAPNRGTAPVSLRAGEFLEKSDDRLRLPAIRSRPEHLFRVNLLPVDAKRGQLRRERHTGLPNGERGDDPPRWTGHDGMQGTAGLAHAPAVAAEDPEGAGD